MVTRLIALILLLICLPLLLFIGILIIIVERDKFLFAQKRLGLNKCIFIIYKIRTMKNHKITFLGKVLRKTGIDEIPQLFNIIKGDINFIGPRPLTQSDVIRLNWDSNFHSKRWFVKPGLTGLSQLSPICNKKMSIFWDNYYVKHNCFTLNFKVISASFLTLLIGKKNIKKIIQNNLKK